MRCSWLTGLWLYTDAYEACRSAGHSTPSSVSPVLLQAAIIVINIVARRAAAGTPPPACLPQRHIATRLLLVLAVALAVFVFN